MGTIAGHKDWTVEVRRRKRTRELKTRREGRIRDTSMVWMRGWVL
jgi:hypothetical protein